jgi:hypothetical protein
MKHKLISIALIAVLLCTVLGNSIACTTPTTNYTLTMSSTAGGSVAPAVGAYTYAAGTPVNLTATPNAGYRFVNWTGGGTDIANANAAATTITMNADHTVTAHFALGTLIEDVPDTNQPPTATLTPPPPQTNYCAPMAMVNILGYWDVVMGHANAQNLTAWLQPPNLKTVAEYLGYFMDTNNIGSPDRLNGIDGHMGTWDKDIGPGTMDFVRWDGTHPPPTAPPFGLPAGKLGYDWTVTWDVAGNFTFYKAEIDAGRPAVVCFSYWNPVAPHVAVVDPETQETIDVYAWGAPITHAYQNNPDNPEEEWYNGIGHAVTGVGYILNWDPDGAGALPQGNYVIVHDNWGTTPKNVAVLWANWNSTHAVDPGS